MQSVVHQRRRQVAEQPRDRGRRRKALEAQERRDLRLMSAHLVSKGLQARPRAAHQREHRHDEQVYAVVAALTGDLEALLDRIEHAQFAQA